MLIKTEKCKCGKEECLCEKIKKETLEENETKEIKNKNRKIIMEDL